MAPIRRKKRSGSLPPAPTQLKPTAATITAGATTNASIIASAQYPPQLQPAPPILSNMMSSTQLSPSKAGMKTPSRLKSPLRRVNGGGITKIQKQMLLDNLELEINERVRRLRAQYEVQAGALKQRIELRINRVPKKFWSAKMGELLAQNSGIAPALSSFPSNARSAAGDGPLNARAFVQDVKRLSMSSTDSKAPASSTLAVPKKRSKKPPTNSPSKPTVMPPPPALAAPSQPAPPPTHFPLSPSKPTSFMTQTRPLSPIKQSPIKPPQSPIKRPQAPLNSSIINSSDVEPPKPPSRPNSRATVKSTTSTITRSSKPPSSKTKTSSSSRPTTAKSTTTTTAATASKSKAAPLGDTSNAGGGGGGGASLQHPIRNPVFDESGNNPSKFVKNIGSNGSFKENGGKPVTADGRPFHASKAGLGERNGNGNGKGNNSGDAVKEKVEKIEKGEKGPAGTGTIRRTLRNRK